MLKKKIYILLLFTAFLPIISFSQKVEKGIIDLKNTNLDKAYLLKGNWEFYWNELLSPADLKKRNPADSNFIKVNGNWNNYISNGKKVGFNGYATYKVRVLAPAGNYSLQFHQILTAYKVWINGNLKSSVGEVGKNRKNSKPKLQINEINFKTKSDTIEIIIQVSNFHHGAGGIQEKVFFGKPNKIQQRTTNKLLTTLFIIGAELIFALYFFFLFFFRQKDIAYIFLSLTIILFIGFELVNGEMILVRYYTDISWELAKKIDFFCNYARLTFFTLFIWYSFREYKILYRPIIIVITTLSILFSLTVLFTPSFIFSKTLIPFMIWGMPSFLYLLASTIVGLFKKVPYIIYTFIGILALNLTAINDMLFNVNIINTGYYGSYGLLLLFIGSSITVSLKFSKSSTKVERMTKTYQVYEQIQNELFNIKSFDLKNTLKIIDKYFDSSHLEILIIKRILICECQKQNSEIICGNLEKNFNHHIKTEDIEKAKESLETISTKNKIILPITKSNKLKAILYIEKDEKIKKHRASVEILEMLVPQISTIIDNYSFYWNLENLNQNLEEIIQDRTNLAYKQKKELIEKNEELDEKIEELNISSNVVEDLNDELKKQSEEINLKNKKLDILKKQISLQKNIQTDKQRNIHSSLNYAKKLQKALLSSIQNFPFDEKFIINKPKDIVSGDFYTSIVKDNYWLIGLVDTTGHNVSATFLSFLIESIIEDSFEENPEFIKEPAKLLENIRYKFHKSLNIEKNDKIIKDSFDISLCSINLNSGKMKFSGANQYIIILRKNEPIILEGDNFTIGGFYSNIIKKVSTKEFDIKINDFVYLFSDGYYNQIGEKNKKKLGVQNFISLLKETSVINLQKQKENLIDKYTYWKGNVKQVDDILIVGFKFSKNS